MIARRSLENTDSSGDTFISEVDLSISAGASEGEESDDLLFRNLPNMAGALEVA